MPNLALRLELGQRPDRVLERYLWIDGVQLEEVDPFESESPEAGFACLAQTRRPAVAAPPVRTLAGPTAFGRDHEILRVGMESLRDEPFADTRPVGVGCVDQVHTELDRSPEDTLRFRSIAGSAPRPGTR